MSFTWMHALLDDLVRINSVNAFYSGGPGEAEISRFIESYLRNHGLHVSRQPVLPATETIDARENVLAILPGRQPGKRLILEAHIDTVSVGAMQEPFLPRRENGRVYGRGSVDNKAAWATMMAPIIDLKRSNITPSCEVVLAATVDEEFSIRGVNKLVEEFTADGAIVAEPTNQNIVVAGKGVLRWRMTAVGRSAHSSKCELGINAIHHIARLIVAIEEHHRRLHKKSHPMLGTGTGNVGLVQGGLQVNFVPDRCSIEIDRRLLPDERPEAVLAEYALLVDKLRVDDPTVAIELESPYIVDPSMETPASASIVLAAQQAADHVGLDRTLHGVPFGSDASKLSRKGIPTIIFGPGSIDQAHNDDEYVEADQVDWAFEFYRRAALEFVG